MTTAQDGGKVISLTHRPTLPPGNSPGTHFCYMLGQPQRHSAIGRILCQWKIPVTPNGIETATFRFLAQHLNYCATAVPNTIHVFFCLTNLLYRKWSRCNSADRSAASPACPTRELLSTSYIYIYIYINLFPNSQVNMFLVGSRRL